MAVDDRDRRNQDVQAREAALVRLLEAGRSKDDPEVKAAITETQKAQHEFGASVARLKSSQ